MLIQNDEILVIFQYLQYKQNIATILKLQSAASNSASNSKYLDVLKSKEKLRTFSLLQFYDAAKKSLLKLTEHLELDSKITLKTWSFKLT